MAGSADEDDFATVPVPDEARSGWPPMYFAVMGIATALFNMQIIATITLSYGTTIALWTIVYAVVVGGLFGSAIVRSAINTGFGISLLARRVLGYRGASLFSMMAAFTGFTFFCAEADIMAASLKGVTGSLPDWITLPALAMIMVPLVYFGIRALARFQLATFFLYLVLVAIAIGISVTSAPARSDWLSFQPGARIDFGLALLTAIGLVNGSMFPIILVTADYARYVEREASSAGQWWLGPIFQFCTWGLQGAAGIWFAIRYSDANPGSFFVTMLGTWGIVLAVATQLRINLVNMYSGSLAVVNLVRQASDIVVSRHALVLLFGIVSAIGLVSGVTEYILPSLKIIGLFLMSFTILLLADLYLVRPVRNASSLPYEVGKIENWRPSAIISLLASTAVGGFLITGAAGARAELWATFATVFVQLLLYLIASAFEHRRNDARPSEA